MALTRPNIWGIDTSVQQFLDPITVLHHGSTTANVDVGFLLNRANGLVSNVAIYWSESGNAFVTAFTTSSGTTNANITVGSYANLKTGSVTVSGAIVPTANMAYDIGSPTLRFRSLYLSGNTIDLSGATIKSNGSSIEFTNPAGGSFSVTGSSPGQSTGTFGNVVANSGVASTSTTSGALQVTGGVGISGAVYAGSIQNTPIGSTTTSTGAFTTVSASGITSITNSTNNNGASYNNGALQVTGGVGVGGNLYVGGTLFAANMVSTSTEILSVEEPLLYLNANNPSSYGYEIGFYSHFVQGSYQHTGLVRDHNDGMWKLFSNVGEPTGATVSFTNATYDSLKTGSLTLANSTASSSSTTGALVVTGGVGIGGDLNLAGSVNTGTWNATTIATSKGGTGLTSFTSGGALYATSTSALTTGTLPVASGGTGTTTSTGTGSTVLSASPTLTGTLTTAAVTSSGTVTITNSTASTSTSTGALQVTGGAAVQGNLFVGSVYTSAGLFWSGNGNIISTGGGGSAPAGNSGSTQYNNGGVLGATNLYYFSANTSVVAIGGVASTSTTSGQVQILGGLGVTGAIYAGSLYDNGTRVVSGSTGNGNLTVSSGLVSLPAHGPGATSAGSSTAIPVISVDGYGRLSTLSTAAVVAPAGTLSGSTLASGVTASSLTSVGTLTGLTTSGAITSTLATGTAPFSITSTTKVSNLNVDMIDGAHLDSAYNSFGSSTIPLRHSSGYLFSNYFNMTADTTTSAATKIAVETGSDGYLRWQTPAQFVTNSKIVDYKNHTAQFTLTGGGSVTYNGTAVLWSSRVIAIPVENSEFGSSGYIDINCPTSGTVTYYNGANATTTVTCTAAGIPLAAWESIYYQVTEGQVATSDATKFRVVNYQNSTWSPGPGWLLIASRNGDDSSIKWLPGQVNIPSGGTYYSSTGVGSWLSPVAGSSSLTTTGTVTSGTWSGSFGAVSGANLTGLTAGNLSGTIPSAVLGNSTHYIGTTAVTLNRASASLSLTGVSIDGSAGTLGGLSKSQLWNNSGQNHGAYNNFATPADFGEWFVHQDTYTDGPSAINVGGGNTGQYYSRSVGLGNDYAYSSYGMQQAIGRNVTQPYHWVRSREGGTWQSWTKVAAGFADTATNQSGGTVAATTGTFSTSATRNSRNIPTYVAASSAPASPLQGDFWYNSSSDTLYQYIYDGTNSQWVDISTGLQNASASATASTLALRDASADLYATVFRGKATSAQYADLAENYISDSEYEPGTVVVFGGSEEITVTSKSHDSRVAGVISTNPAYLMNSECEGLPVAFTGRVPCKVIGPVRKGDVLVTSKMTGVAQVIDNEKYVPGCVIGKALENNKHHGVVTIEVAVGRF